MLNQNVALLAAPKKLRTMLCFGSIQLCGSTKMTGV